jgi:hypothetical protein
LKKFFYGLKVLMGLDLLIVEVSWPHTHTHTHTHAVEVLFTTDRPAVQTATWQHPILTRDRHARRRRHTNPSPSKRAAADLRLRPHGRRNWRSESLRFEIQSVYPFQKCCFSKTISIVLCLTSQWMSSWRQLWISDTWHLSKHSFQYHFPCALMCKARSGQQCALRAEACNNEGEPEAGPRPVQLSCLRCRSWLVGTAQTDDHLGQ